MYSRKFIVSFIFSLAFVFSPMLGSAMNLNEQKVQSEMSCCQGHNQKKDNSTKTQKRCKDSKGDCQKKCQDQGCGFCSISLYFNYNQEKVITLGLPKSSKENNFGYACPLAQDFTYKVWQPPKF